MAGDTVPKRVRCRECGLVRWVDSDWRIIWHRNRAGKICPASGRYIRSKTYEGKRRG